MVGSIGGGGNAGFQGMSAPSGMQGNGGSLVTEDAAASNAMSNQAMSSSYGSTGDQISQSKKGNGSQAV